MDGAQGNRLLKEIGADVLMPMHYESWWAHFKQGGDGLRKDFEDAGIADEVRMRWLTPGVPAKILFTFYFLFEAGQGRVVDARVRG